MAVLLVAFYVLASARALVPGLCATLATVPDSAGAATCCAVDVQDCDTAAGGEAIRAAVAHCAFCSLVHTAAQPAHDAVAPSGHAVCETVAELSEGRIPLPNAWNPSKPRDPPPSALTT